MISSRLNTTTPHPPFKYKLYKHRFGVSANVHFPENHFSDTSVDWFLLFIISTPCPHSKVYTLHMCAPLWHKTTWLDDTPQITMWWRTMAHVCGRATMKPMKWRREGSGNAGSVMDRAPKVGMNSQSRDWSCCLMTCTRLPSWLLELKTPFVVLLCVLFLGFDH